MMFFLDENNQVVEKVDIEKMKRTELNELMVAKGFEVKNGHDEV